MEKYTVILIRPDYICEDTPYGQDVYVANVLAESEYLAILVAQSEVFERDSKDDLDPEDADDYAVLAVFDGHIMPKLFGWML